MVRDADSKDDIVYTLGSFVVPAADNPNVKNYINYRATSFIIGSHSLGTAEHVVQSSDGSYSTILVGYPGQQAVGEPDPGLGTINATPAVVNPIKFGADGSIDAENEAGDHAVIRTLGPIYNVPYTLGVRPFEDGPATVEGYPVSNGYRTRQG